MSEESFYGRAAELESLQDACDSERAGTAI